VRPSCDRAPVDAVFAHVWTAREGRLTGLRQITDTARWAG
jgi:ketosteroid isomerase-like protein